MKKTGYLFLLIILLLQTGGILLIFQVQQGYVQYQMSEKLKNDKLPFKKIILSLHEYEQCRVSSNEIAVDGKMYDFKSATFSDNSVELLAVHDAEEEGILEKINCILKTTGSPNTNFPLQLHQLLTLVYLTPFSEPKLFAPSFDFGFLHSSQANIVSNDPDILSPPPQAV